MMMMQQTLASAGNMFFRKGNDGTYLTGPFGKEPGVGRAGSHVANIAAGGLLHGGAIGFADITSVKSLAVDAPVPHSLAAARRALNNRWRRWDGDKVKAFNSHSPVINHEPKTRRATLIALIYHTQVGGMGKMQMEKRKTREKDSHFSPIGGVPFGTVSQVAIADSGDERGGPETGGLVDPHRQRGGYFLFAGQIACLDSIATRYGARGPLAENPTGQEEKECHTITRYSIRHTNGWGSPYKE